MKDRTILAIKGLAIIGVALHHLINRRHDPHATEMIRACLVVFDWCVLAFICVSGYLHAMSDSRKLKSPCEFIVNRFKRLIVPWLLLIFAFSIIWQILQALHISNIAVKIPPDFIGKITVSLWPANATVGEQLYYFPVLFAVSVIFVTIRGFLGMIGVAALVVVSFTVSLTYFPESFTGFHLGVFLWSLCFYAAGYLLFNYRAKANYIRITLILGTIVMILFSGYDGMLRCLPFWMVAEGNLLKLSSLPGLPSLGEASGTIYIYHTPFIIQPLVIASTYLHGAVPQFLGALGAAATAIGICYCIHHLLKNTRAKILLM
jgi:acyltransferase